MEAKEQKYYGRVVQINESEKYIECNILHFGTPNENRWMASVGCLDAFLARIAKAKKNIPACYQHDESIVIGVWKDLTITGDTLSGKLYYVETDFFKGTVLPLLMAGALQGASPTIAPISDTWNQDKNVWEIIEGVLCEVSLVGIPADLKADIIEFRAKIESENKDKQNEDFEFELLTL